MKHFLIIVFGIEFSDDVVIFVFPDYKIEIEVMMKKERIKRSKTVAIKIRRVS